MRNSAEKASNRFTALDSWRGLSACLVAMYHMNANSHLYPLPLIRNAYLFVDFFFVLSGFVIAANYEKRLLNGFGYGKFALLRFGRLYPLHLFVLACFVAFEVVQIVIPGLAAAAQAPPFSAPDQSNWATITNLLLLQGLGFNDQLTWNHPSWSISTEFYTYLLFAAALATFRRYTWIALAIAAVVGPALLLALSPRNMDATFDFGMIRCVTGFSIGVLVWHVFAEIRARMPALSLQPAGISVHILEVTALAATILFVSLAGISPWSVAAPFVFAATVLVFALERGFVSRLLMHRALVLLGALSYSIYMLHFLVVARMETVGHIIEKYTGWMLFTPITGVDGVTDRYFGTTLWLGDLSYCLMLVLIVALSYLTYRYVEEPGRRLFRRLAERKSSSRTG